MNRRYAILPLLAIVLIAAAALFSYMHGAQVPLLAPMGPVAQGERSVILITLALCAIIVVPVFVLLFFFAWKYRAGSPNAHVHHRPDWDHDNRTTEFAWWTVPTIIIAILGVIMWQSTNALDPFKPLSGSGPTLTVDVVALDWKWLFIYPDLGVASVNMLEIPQNSAVHFNLTADAPMNSFWVPSLGGQIMVMPGMTTQLNLLASQQGTFDGFSGNISGKGFSGMAFKVHSVSQDDFEQWVQSVQNASSTSLTLSTYTELAQPSEYNQPAYYAPVDPNLYATVISKFMSP